MKPNLTQVALGALLAAPPAAHAADFSAIGTLTQDEFALLAKDLGAATSYKQLASATPLGITGFDIAAASAFVQLQNVDIWRKATGNADVPSTIPVPGIRVAKGLPFGIDIGATYSEVPKVKGSLAGVELRWAALEGGVLSPAIGLRLAATKLSGVDQVALNNVSADVSISKGFAIITPYAGVGVARTAVSAKGTALADETPTQSRAFAGGHLNLGLFDITAEGDRTGKVSSYSVRLGFRF